MPQTSENPFFTIVAQKGAKLQPLKEINAGPEEGTFYNLRNAKGQLIDSELRSVFIRGGFAYLTHLDGTYSLVNWEGKILPNAKHVFGCAVNDAQMTYLVRKTKESPIRTYSIKQSKKRRKWSLKSFYTSVAAAAFLGITANGVRNILNAIKQDEVFAQQQLMETSATLLEARSDGALLFDTDGDKTTAEIIALNVAPKNFNFLSRHTGKTFPIKKWQEKAPTAKWEPLTYQIRIKSRG